MWRFNFNTNRIWKMTTVVTQSPRDVLENHINHAEYRVGLDFNPSKNDRVHDTKIGTALLMGQVLAYGYDSGIPDAKECANKSYRCI